MVTETQIISLLFGRTLNKRLLGSSGIGLDDLRLRIRSTFIS